MTNRDSAIRAQLLGIPSRVARLLFSAIRAQLLGIPSRVARLLLGKSDYKEVYDIINDAILATLELLAAYNPHTFNERNEKYLATLFPEATSQKSNGNRENKQSEAEDDEPAAS
jgi:hypothetical protein